jgi:hypothetical protein
MTAPPLPRRALAPGLALALALAACGPGADGPSSAARTCPITAPPTAGAPVGFASVVLPAIQASCGVGSVSCHGKPTAGELPKGKIELYAGGTRTAAAVYADLVNQAPTNAPAGMVYVKPGDPGQSWLYSKVSEAKPGVDGYGERMPLGAPILCDPTLEVLRGWIADGALP